ncbi:DUF7344 domain-containing protein [Halomarina litorea]|uniref:DUF7344 domain-containing protein n=1 Tax=Halomarina litorea TaxID=2961595 RepID=UPI0020C28880|nr:hypothetical protein [Halomarina sp. BCD28]
MVLRHDQNALPETVVDELLAEPRRRLLLGVLYDRGERMSVADLGRELAVAGTDPTPDGRREMRRAIREDDLPKLLATDVVRYDSTLDAVSLSGAARQFEDRLTELARELR